MAAGHPVEAGKRLLMSACDAVARAVWEAGVRVAAAHRGAPVAGMLDVLATYPDMYTESSVNEKVSLEVALGTAMAGARAFCAMRYGGVSLASDVLMTIRLGGGCGGLVIAVVDDGARSSHEHDPRCWGRLAHVPVFEPTDPQDAYDCTRAAFALSERFAVPVLLRLALSCAPERSLVSVGERQERGTAGFVTDVACESDLSRAARVCQDAISGREDALREVAERSPFNVVEASGDWRVGFITSGAVYRQVREAFPAAPVLKLGLSYPLPRRLIKDFVVRCAKVVVVEDGEALVETEVRAQGVSVHGKDILPRHSALTPAVLGTAVARLLGAPYGEAGSTPEAVLPAPATMCSPCQNFGVYYALAQMRNTTIVGEVACCAAALGAALNAFDHSVSLGASLGVALGLDKGRSAGEVRRKVVAVIGESAFLHLGLQGLLDIVSHRGNVAVLIVSDSTAGVSCGWNPSGRGSDNRGTARPVVDLVALVRALGVADKRVHVVDPYALPTVFNVLRREVNAVGPSVILAHQNQAPHMDHRDGEPYRVDDERCTGCAVCADIGCPAIRVSPSDGSGQSGDKTAVRAVLSIDSHLCTGCGLCLSACASTAIVAVGAMASFEVSGARPVAATECAAAATEGAC